MTTSAAVGVAADAPPPPESYDWQQIVADLNRLLRLTATPVGMKLFERVEEMEAVPRIRRPQTKYALDQIVALFSPGGVLDPGKSLVVAELLYEHGELKTLEGEDGVAYQSRVRALGLYLEVSGRESLERIPDADRYLEKIETLLGELAPYGPASEIQKRLIWHYEREGAYADAEDTLFELIDAGHAELVPEGIELYERLLAKPDDALERGKLPREEVEEGLAQLRAR